MAVYFFNAEPIDINSIAIMGVSVKTGDSPIGFFGTGLKFAIATLLRSGCKITLIRNGEKIPFSVVSEEIRGETFERVVMADERLGFTTKLGRNWEPWQAYRELYCNCLDEGGQITTVSPTGEWGTVFVVEGEAIEICHRNRREIFLDTTPIASDTYCEIHPGETMSAFYRGVKAHKHQLPALYTYNVKTSLNLTEDRTIKESFYLNHYICRLIPMIEDEDVVERIILAGSGTFEQRLDIASYGKPSAAFMRVCHRHRHNGHANQSAIKLWEKHAETSLTYEVVLIDAYEETVLEKATDLLKRLNCPIGRHDFVVVSNLGESIYGMVRANQILISKRTFDMGHRFLASTLYEEWLHKSEHFEDESRDLQNFLFEKLFAMTERVLTMEERSQGSSIELEDAAAAAFRQAQSVYRADHDHFPLKNNWQTADEKIRDGWRKIAAAALSSGKLNASKLNENDEYVRADALQSSGLVLAGEAVKKLEWIERSPEFGTLYAGSVIGKWEIWEIGGRGYMKAPGEQCGKACDGDLETAKAAAQADYEQRILSALAAPQPVEPVTWQTMDTAPKDGTVIQAWHSVHKCPMSVLWKGDGFPFRGERLNWYERSYTTAWPERAFTHWCPLPPSPVGNEEG